jgi:glycerate 2-kinase
VFVLRLVPSPTIWKDGHRVAAAGRYLFGPFRAVLVIGTNGSALNFASTGLPPSTLALAAVSELAGVENVLLVTLATDGEDGPTDAAGAVVTGETWQRAQEAGLHPPGYLNNNDSYHFFKQLGDGLHPGSTGTNVNDLTFLFAL